MILTAICAIKDEPIPRVNLGFPLFLTSYDSIQPLTKSSPIPTRTQAFHLLLSYVKTPWTFFFSPNTKLIPEKFPCLDNNYELLYNKGINGEPNSSMHWAIFVKTNCFPILDNDLEEPVALAQFFQELKLLKFKEVKSYWEYENWDL